MAFASLTPVKSIDCGIFQFAALKFKVDGATVMADVLLETKFKVLAIPGFPDKETEIRVVPPSFTEVAPVKTGLESLSVVVKSKVEFVTAKADAVTVTVSAVSFPSSSPFIVIVFGTLQQSIPGQTLSKVTDAVDTVSEATFPEAKLTKRGEDGS